MSEHTPLPWATDPDDRDGMEWNIHIVEADRPHMRICFMSNGPQSEANAAFIVKAVNRDHHFEALVKALREARRFVEVDPTALTATVLLAQINETLAAAGRGK